MYGPSPIGDGTINSPLPPPVKAHQRPTSVHVGQLSLRGQKQKRSPLSRCLSQVLFHSFWKVVWLPSSNPLTRCIAAHDSTRIRRARASGHRFLQEKDPHQTRFPRLPVSLVHWPAKTKRDGIDWLHVCVRSRPKHSAPAAGIRKNRRQDFVWIATACCTVYGLRGIHFMHGLS